MNTNLHLPKGAVKFVPSVESEYPTEFLHKMSEGYHPVKARNKDNRPTGPVHFVRVLQVSNVAGAVRSALGKAPTSRLDDLLFEDVRDYVIAPFNFDVVDHLARRMWNKTTVQWNNLQKDMRDGFLSLTYRAITGAIQKSRMF